MPIGLPADIPAPLLQLEWCAPFTGTTRRALHALKYDGERRIAPYVGAAVARRWARAGAGGDLLVPVPASPDRVRDRGYDQAALIAAEAGRRLRLPVLQRAGADAGDDRPVRPRPGRARLEPGRCLPGARAGQARRSAGDGSCSSTTSSPPARPSPRARRRSSTRAPRPSRRSPGPANDEAIRRLRPRRYDGLPARRWTCGPSSRARTTRCRSGSATYAERKLGRLERLLDDRSDATVELSVEQHRSVQDSHIVDVTLVIDGQTLRSSSAASDAPGRDRRRPRQDRAARRRPPRDQPRPEVVGDGPRRRPRGARGPGPA